MRISGMSAFQMLGWRGLCLGLIFIILWGLTSRSWRSDLGTLGSGTALIVVASQLVNTTLFPIGIAIAPVAPVLLGVATVPVWSALLAQWLYAETATRATWIAIVLVIMGLTLAISDKGNAALDAYALAGAACGLGVAFALAMTFVTFTPQSWLAVTSRDWSRFTDIRNFGLAYNWSCADDRRYAVGHVVKRLDHSAVVFLRLERGLALHHRLQCQPAAAVRDGTCPNLGMAWHW
jgi:EamA-like transporter family.